MPTVFSDQTPTTTGTNLNAASLNGLISGLTAGNMSSTAGLTAGMISTVNGSSLVTGVRQIVFAVQTNDLTLSAASGASYAATFSPAASITTTGSSRVRVRWTMQFNTLSSNAQVTFHATVNGVLYHLGTVIAFNNPGSGATIIATQFCGVALTPVLSAGTYPVSLTYDSNQSSISIPAATTPTQYHCVLEIEEVA